MAAVAEKPSEKSEKKKVKSEESRTPITQAIQSHYAKTGHVVKVFPVFGNNYRVNVLRHDKGKGELPIQSYVISDCYFVKAVQTGDKIEITDNTRRGSARDEQVARLIASVTATVETVPTVVAVPLQKKPEPMMAEADE
jgi:hypothetical protein